MVVVDASAAYKWFSKEEPYFEASFKIIAEHKLGKQEIIAPYFLVCELANAWATKTDLTLRQAKLNLKKLQDANIELFALDFPLIQRALTFSRKYQITVYDAIYVALAQAKKCNLITADEKLLKRVKLSFVKSLANYS